VIDSVRFALIRSFSSGFTKINFANPNGCELPVDVLWVSGLA